jgi:hypothetical protein
MRADNRNYALRLGKVLGLVLLLLLFFAVLATNLLPFFDSENALMDFGSFYASGLKLRGGEFRIYLRDQLWADRGRRENGQSQSSDLGRPVSGLAEVRSA